MNKIVSLLLSAQKTSQVLHWNTKTFSLHVALGELYDKLVQCTDELSEMHIGLTGEIIKLGMTDNTMFDNCTEREFIQVLLTNVCSYKEEITDSALLNKFEELIGMIQRIKYKVDKLI